MHGEKTYTAITAPLPGKVVDIRVTVGAQVKVNDVLLILEAMKMENEIVSELEGNIKEIKIKNGDVVNTNDEMIIIESIEME